MSCLRALDNVIPVACQQTAFNTSQFFHVNSKLRRSVERVPIATVQHHNCLVEKHGFSALQLN